ncbi:uncharacterized protein [Drosophila bipectinata]|uniref:uncharacterized protein isoform X1 n=1 Tax=Drosophila bipectinata TaxID=42026 RepID=UPI001C8AA6B2|nr:uncharacterized protein LOC108128864 [Drosophila bipectinata]KAH8277054.1 hypothetical protein KR026_004441 [Drosophila bipectinata]
MSSWVVSTIDLHDCGANGTSSSGPSSRHKHFILLVWHRLAEKCERFSSFLKRETNKPLPKELRRSLRLNKSARRKGYQSCESEADKRIMKERLNEPANLSVRMGPAYDFRPSNF